MATPPISDPDGARRRDGWRRGFTLVEVAIALAIIAFSLVPIFGLMSIGTGVFRKAVDTSTGSQIAQIVLNDAQQSEFSVLTAAPPEAPPNGARFAKPVRYFDVEGDELNSATGKNYLANAVYLANTVVQPATSLPDSSGLTNPRMATVIVQVAYSPGGIVPTPDGTTKLWPGGNVNGTVTYAALVANSAPIPSPNGQ